MPEVEFYLEESTRLELFHYLKETGSELIVDDYYPNPAYKTVETDEEFLDWMKKIGSFFITNPKFTKYPLCWGYNEDLKIYFIWQRKGGPHIHIIFYKGYADDAAIKLPATWLSYYPYYYCCDDLTCTFDAPEGLKEYYKEVTRFLRKKCKRVKVNGRYYYVDRKALKKLGLK